ncbi:putative MmgE/PrpD family protein [Annulohypoxylon nitens]|nr:putative MmgE/PrpD family protein [Annulohypoxylon nitens]
MASNNPTYRMAHWALNISRERTLAAEARQEAARGLRDLLGCLVGGAVEPVPQRIAKVAISIGARDQGPCTIVGHPERVSAPAAALANGAAAHILDFDDSFRPLTGHPSCTIVPAILAVAEEYERSFEDLLDAYVVGIEIAATIGRAAPKHHDVGWHGTATVGVISSAVACARLLGLDVNATAAAISIAVSSASGSRVQIGYDVKCLQPGAAARDAVMAAYLSKEGIRGSPEVLTGRWGWSKLYSELDGDGREYTFPTPTEPLAVVNPGITFKPYPTCGSTHRTLAAVLHLCHKYDIKADDVQSIETIIPFLNTANLRYPNPIDGMQAKFSMPYACSVAVLHRKLRLEDFEDDAVKRAEVQELMPRVRMITLEGSEHSDKTFLEQPCYTKIIMRSGVTYEDTRFDRPGEASQPLTEEEEEFKFLDCTRKAFSLPYAQRIWKNLHHLSQDYSVRDLMASLRQQ